VGRDHQPSAIRVSADFNGLGPGLTPGRTAVVLDTFGALRDLANAGVVLREGLPLVAHDASDETEDLEGHGVARYDPAHGWWIVEFDEVGVRCVPAGDRTWPSEFLCVSCRVDLAGELPAAGTRPGQVCSACGTPLLAPLAAPRLWTTGLAAPSSIDDVLAFLSALGAVPHLVRHHRLVAEAAIELCDGLSAAGMATFDRVEVLVGAALHDVGKVLHPDEMHRVGDAHERSGHRLLLEHGVPERFARHAWMHASWRGGAELEPVLVALADKLWKGKRVQELEEHAVRLLAHASGRDFWTVWNDAEAVFDGVAAAADWRLARSADGGG